MKTIRILILEDDLKTLSVIMGGLFDFEERLFNEHINIAVTVFSEYLSVEDYINKIDQPNFDIILLDRDCKLGGSFHAINVKKFGADNFISISTQPEYNETASRMGVKRFVRKDYKHLDNFCADLIKEIEELVNLAS